MLKRIPIRVVSLLLSAVMFIGILPTYVFSAGSVTNYADFMEKFRVLETYAAEYHGQIVGSKTPGELVLNFIRTGVERYQDDNWVTLAGQEETGFINVVQAWDTEKGTTVMDLRDIVTADFKLPNGNPVDFGHMFGCMNISYINKGSADLSGWAGDLCDLLYYCVDKVSVPDGTVDEMAEYILTNCFGVDADDAFGWDDFYGDMDAYYLVSEYQKGNGSFSDLMEAYFTENLTDVARAVYFVNNRFGVEDSQEAVRKAIYESYSNDIGIKILESKRGLTSYTNLREACCYAFADYLYNLAKGQLVPSTGSGVEADNEYYTVFSNDHSILAPGIEQDINYAQTADGKQIVYYVATVDVTREDVTIMVNYKNNDPSSGWGLQRVEDQVAAMVANHADVENFHPIVATNGDGYNIMNGTPGGLVIMEGVEYYPVDRDGFFAILKDGSAMIGTQAEFEAYKDQIQEGIGGFGAVLVKDGKINVTKNANYTASRASRTAIGIKADGKVVMMVLDGRQLPFSAGGAMEEIAQIMLDAGCVHAINLDGGGSTTYLSKPAGSDSIQLINRPSDGYARMVATSLVAVSTAKSSNEFDHAIISSEYEYITAGTSMQFTVTGVSNTGHNAVIPAGAYWEVSDETIGAIDANGLFTAANNGDVTIRYIVNGEVAGSKQIHVVIPDDIRFAEDRIVAIYGVPQALSLTLWYQGNPVAFNTETDLFLGLEDGKENAGAIDGIVFTGNEASGIRTVMVAAFLYANEELFTYSTINMYRADETLFDFDNATQGNRTLAWNREVSNTKTLDDQLYRIVDPDAPIVIDYTFALDMTTIDIPPQLEPLKTMLPDGTNPDASAWSFLLSLAERVCVQTNVKITADFSKDLLVNVDNLKVINDYFELTSVNLDADNRLTVICNWRDQTQPIEPTTANPLCILTGITATVKDTASYYNNELAIANNGNVSYDIYLAASSLYSFVTNPENDAQNAYGLYPFVHDPACRTDGNDAGGRFSSQYVDFADVFVINSEIRQGWIEDSYYVDNEAVTGIHLVPDRHNPEQKRFCEFDANGILISEQGVTGLVTYEGDLYYAVFGVAQTGWQQIDNNNYYFHPDTGKAVDGVFAIYENANSYTTNWYTYTFTNHVLTLGDMVYETTNEMGNVYQSGYRYRWAGRWLNGWFEVEGNTYYAAETAPFFVATGYASVPTRDTLEHRYHLFDETGVFQSNYNDIWHVGEDTYFINQGIRERIAGLYQADSGYIYYVNGENGKLYKDVTLNVNVLRAHGLAPAGNYYFDAQGRLTNPLVTVTTQVSGITYTVFGRLVTVTPAADTSACMAGYLKDGSYIALEAIPNADGSYGYSVPAETNAITIILAGDVTCDGVVDDNDVDLLARSLQPGAQALTAEQAFAADVNRNGKINSADRTLIARSLVDKTHLLYNIIYKPLAW